MSLIINHKSGARFVSADVKKELQTPPNAVLVWGNTVFFTLLVSIVVTSMLIPYSENIRLLVYFQKQNSPVNESSKWTATVLLENNQMMKVRQTKKISLQTDLGLPGSTKEISCSVVGHSKDSNNKINLFLKVDNATDMHQEENGKEDFSANGLIVLREASLFRHYLNKIIYNL